MTVLVLRPAPACFELVDMLDKIDMRAIAAPLLSFEEGKALASLAGKLKELPTNSIVIAVSPRAVEFAQKALEEAPWRTDLHYVAIGKETARSWRQLAAVSAKTPKQENSEGLLTLALFNQIQNRNILILRGNGGRTLLANKLKQLGAKVCYFETYRRLWNKESVLSQTKLWKENKVEVIVITSGEQLDLLWNSTDEATQLWLIQCQLFVPSQRICHQAKSLGFKTVINVDSANNKALFVALNKNAGKCK